MAAWELKSLNGVTLWSGEPHPSPKRLSQILASDGPFDPHDISFLTLQLLHNASPKSLPALLNILTCYLYKESGDHIDVSILSELDSLNTSYICGKPLNKGDIVWTCRQCGHDPSCVQCNECFQLSDHKNHEVYFYKSSGAGGCCDCGDTEAWKEGGCCSRHRADENAKMIDPVSLIPPNIMTGYGAVLDAIALYFYSLVVREIDGFSSLSERFDRGEGRGNEMVIRLHNDDIHSYDDVISALREIELSASEAEQKTVAVDKAGYALVRRQTDPDLLESNWKSLAQEASLLVSVIPSELCIFEETMSAVWSWVHLTTAKNVGLLRLLTNALVKPISEMYLNASSPIITYLAVPLVYPSFPIRHTPSTAPPFEVDLPPGTDGTPADVTTRHTKLNPFSPNLPNNCPMTLLSLLMASSPYLIKEWQNHLHDMVILGLKDIYFKNVYSQFFLHLYCHLSCLFFHGIGTDKESLFHTTVQTFSTESVVSMLSSEGYLSNSRPFKEPTILSGRQNVGVFSLIPMLSSWFKLLISSSDLMSGPHEETLSSSAFRHQRYRHILHDLDFAMSCGNQYKEFFLVKDSHGKTAFHHWIDVLAAVHGLKPFTRIPAGKPHALYDDPTWQEAISFIVEIENVTCSIVSHTLSSKSTADVNTMLKILQTSITEILIKLDTLYESTQDSFRPSVESSAYPFEWATSYNITSGKSVSIFTPLARFLARLLHSASAWCLPFSLQRDSPRVISEMRGLSIACDYALRNFSFSSQVEIDLWRRNGLGVVNLIYNYNRSTLSKFFRDLDLIVVQLGIALIGPDTVLKNMFEAFECSLLESVRVRKLKYSTRAQMFAEMLRWVILLATYLPHDMSKFDEAGESKMDLPLSERKEGLELSVDRIVAHLLLSGKKSKGKLQSVKSLFRLDTQIGDDDINASAERLCQIKSQPSEQVLLEPKYSEVLKLFDPEHPYLPSRELQLANESARAHRNKPEVVALLSSHCVQRPPMKVMVLPVIFPAAMPQPHPEFRVVRNLLLSPYFYKLMITALSLPASDELVNLTSASDESKIPKSIVVVIISRCVHLLTLQLHSAPPNIFDQYLDEWNQIWPLLIVAHQLKLLQEDQLYSQGLEWLLREYCWRSRIARSTLLQLNYDGAAEIEEILTKTKTEISATTTEDPKDTILEQRKLRARQKALASMQKNVSAFSAQIGEEGLDETKEHQNGPECIICREKNENPVGYFIHIQPSQVLHRSISLSSSELSNRYLVIRPAPVFGTPVDLSSPIKPQPNYILQEGDIITSGERSLLSWIRISTPHGEGWVELFETIVNESDSRRQAFRVHLLPLEFLTHSRHGAVRPFVSSCGHGLHLDCWSNYLFTSMQQQQRQASEVSAERGEVVCPLCKTIANGILPYQSKGFQEIDQQNCFRFSLADAPLFGEYLFERQGRSDTIPAFDVLVADNCLSKSHITTRSVTLGTSGHIEKNILALRQLQALWSATGYSLLSIVTSGDSANHKNLLTTVDHLFRCSQRAREWFAADFSYHQMILSDLRELLFTTLESPIKLSAECQIEELNVNSFTKFLSLQPLPVVYDSICPEDSNTLQKAFGKYQSHATSSSPLWPFLKQPLLSHDLHMIAVAMSSNASCAAEALNLLSVLCLARLCQLLLEPSCTGLFAAEDNDVGKKRARIPSESSNAPFVPGDLTKLRDGLCEIVGLTCESLVDSHVVVDLWTPYLLFTSALRSIIMGAEYMLSTDIFELLHGCGLGELIQNPGGIDQIIQLNGVFLVEMSNIWAQQYSNYYGCVFEEKFQIKSVKPQTDAEAAPETHWMDSGGISRIEHLLDGDQDYEDNGEDDDDEDEEDNEIEAANMIGIDTELEEMANDPALLLPEEIQDVDVAEMREWLLQSGLDVNSGDIHQILGALDRNLTKGSLLCGVDPIETPFRDAPGTRIATIPPLVGSLTGLKPYLNSTRQNRLTFPLFDNSHLGFGQRHHIKLIDLPEQYTDLYQLAKFPSFLGNGKPIENPAICLVCGRIVSAGNRLGVTSRLFLTGPGECTLHASDCGAGIGLFFLVEKCQTLLLYGPRAVYHPSLYLDEYGECSVGHNRPLYLSAHRYHRLQGMYANHEIAKEIIRIRLGERSVIRLNYY